MTKAELKKLQAGIKRQIKDIKEEKKNHLMQARLCTFNINALQRRLKEIDVEIKMKK